MSLAVATRTPPSWWWDEDDEAICTYLELLDAEADEVERMREEG